MQLTVFLENSEGRLSALCRTLADAGINMSALAIAGAGFKLLHWDDIAS